MAFLEVNHAFHGFVQASPSIQHEIDLFGAGLQRNPKTNMSLTDCRVALELYCRSWETLDPAEEWDDDLPSSAYKAANLVGGTFGILWKNSVKFITLGSISRGIPRKEWDVSLKDLEASTFSFYPRANVLVVVEEAEFM